MNILLVNGQQVVAENGVPAEIELKEGDQLQLLDAQGQVITQPPG